MKIEYWSTSVGSFGAGRVSSESLAPKRAQNAASVQYQAENASNPREICSITTPRSIGSARIFANAFNSSTVWFGSNEDRQSVGRRERPPAGPASYVMTTGRLPERYGLPSEETGALNRPHDAKYIV